jgi:hypothetical protein
LIIEAFAGCVKREFLLLVICGRKRHIPPPADIYIKRARLRKEDMRNDGRRNP